MAADEPIVRARQLIDRGCFGEATELLENHLASRGDDRLARSLLAHAHFRHGSLVAAEAQYRVLVAQPSPNPRDLYSLGATLEKQGKLEEAMYWYDAARRADPAFTQAVAARERVAQAQQAREATAARGATEATPSAKPAGPFVPTELGIPLSEEDLGAYEKWKREKEKSDWWTENWYRLPVPLRVLKAVSLLLVLAIAVGIAYGLYRVATRDGSPSGGTTQTFPTDTITTPTITTTDTETIETDPSGGDSVAGKDVFVSSSAFCGDCHTLADAGTTGTSGPNLDEAKPSEELVVERVMNGSGAMPSYAGKLTDEQIADVAAYVATATAAS
jgi:cytochrome c6